MLVQKRALCKESGAGHPLEIGRALYGLLVRAYLLSDVPGVRLRRSATTNAAAAAANFWPLSGICIDVQAFSRMFFQPRSEALRSRTVTPDSTRDLAPPSCS